MGWPRALLVAGSVGVVAAAFGPWSRSGEAVRSSFATVQSASGWWPPS
ncbi:hypothetical protein BH24ACT3_BH24ACT3_11380 [soil metagenome]